MSLALGTWELDLYPDGNEVEREILCGDYNCAKSSSKIGKELGKEPNNNQIVTFQTQDMTIWTGSMGKHTLVVAGPDELVLVKSSEHSREMYSGTETVKSYIHKGAIFECPAVLTLPTYHLSPSVRTQLLLHRRGAHSGAVAGARRH